MSDKSNTFTIPPDGTMQFVGCKEGMHWKKLTPSLRWLGLQGRPYTKLQQASVCGYCGDITWCDVPTETEASK